MKISGIDKDFVDIIEYLDKMGFKPFASCDGVLKNHSNPNNVNLAYIAFLESPQVIDLMAAFLRDKDTFEVTISNNTQSKPYYLYGNLIEGNRYMVRFSNKMGDKTNYFKDIIKKIAEKKTNIIKTEKEKLCILEEILKDDKSSDLYFELSFNSKYQPYMKKDGRINVLKISTKEGNNFYRDMNKLADILCEKCGIKRKFDNMQETFIEKEFVISSYDSSGCEIYFSDEHIEQVLKLIKGIKKIEGTLPTFKVKDNDYDDIYYPNDDEEPEI